MAEAITPPAWWHGRGTAVLLIEGDANHVRLGSHCAWLMVIRRGDHWLVEWHIARATAGDRHFTLAQVRQAFGLDTAPASPVLVRPGDFLADAYAPGLYIRSGDYLNVPTPGMGVDGDPNVSVYLTDDIRRAIAALQPA